MPNLAQLSIFTLSNMSTYLKNFSSISLILLLVLSSCTENSTLEFPCSPENLVASQSANQLPNQSDRFIIERANKSGFIDRLGREIIPPIYDTIREFYENRAAFKKDRKWGFIDINGNVVILPQFEEVTNFVEGRAIFKKDSKRGLIDASGKIVIEPNIDDLYSVYEQRLAFMKNNKWGLMDLEGNIIVEPYFTQISVFSEGLAIYSIESQPNSQELGLLDRNGRIINKLSNNLNLSFEPDIKSIRFNNGRLPVYKIDSDLLPLDKWFDARVHSLWGYIDRTGHTTVPLKYDSVSDFSECLAQVKKTGIQGFIDPLGKIVIDTKPYDAVGFFSEGLAPVQIQEKWGYIDRTGKVVINFQFDGATGFSNGLASVNINGKWGAIDRQGTIIIKPQFDNALNFIEPLSGVTIGKQSGYIDRTGKFVWIIKK
ncbi:MAG: WG repeat-containing protein [Microcoleus sp. PH2017_22_RUC_O_B]|uniref:WG repeat-containing protein n=1 Tax=unclassified Microcoleus TaxID=2642155 RepID=UPI001E134B66|nr:MULTISPECIES: WG repeat-containing protein [unclassified Microcoleus]MCC3529452.1 WG repeat-containing protein [Microcoleus sp. PH2017_21_RUC_O_A]MCC3541675.1 WG repeat-containing protein [Microcoleus sp. PH2017_22_RUC_O_B]